MIINDRAKKLLPISKMDDFYVVADFDKTITSADSKTSWSILSENKLVSDTYEKERKDLYDKYRPAEIDETMDFEKRSELVSEWYKKHIELLVKYKIDEEVFSNIASDLKIMGFRKGAKNFFEFLNSNDVPVVIISAGIGNVIEQFLKANDCLYDNVYISSNRVIFKDKIAAGVGDNIIHSLNKNEVSLPDKVKRKLLNRDNVILLGDQLSDLNMVDETKHNIVIKVGFYSPIIGITIEKYSEYFDIVCATDDDYNTLSEILFLK